MSENALRLLDEKMQVQYCIIFAKVPMLSYQFICAAELSIRRFVLCACTIVTWFFLMSS